MNHRRCSRAELVAATAALLPARRRKPGRDNPLPRRPQAQHRRVVRLEPRVVTAVDDWAAQEWASSSPLTRISGRNSLAISFPSSNRITRYRAIANIAHWRDSRWAADNR